MEGRCSLLAFIYKGLLILDGQIREIIGGSWRRGQILFGAGYFNFDRRSHVVLVCPNLSRYDLGFGFLGVRVCSRTGMWRDQTEDITSILLLCSIWWCALKVALNFGLDGDHRGHGGRDSPVRGAVRSSSGQRGCSPELVCGQGGCSPEWARFADRIFVPGREVAGTAGSEQGDVPGAAGKEVARRNCGHRARRSNVDCGQQRSLVPAAVTEISVQGFVYSVPNLIGQEAQLEDSYGERLTVKLSNIEDSLAFEEGWSFFSKDHRLKVGELLVFHYIYPSRLFFLQIYGASGCPKYRRDEGNGSLNKRARTEGDSGDKNEDFHMAGNELGSKSPVGSGTFDIHERQPGSTRNTVDFDSGIQRVPVVPETRHYEESFCMINKDDGYIQGENRSYLYDLSKYELSVGAEKLSHRGSAILEPPTGAGILINDSVNISGDLLKICFEKPVENGEKSGATPEDEAVRRKAEKPRTNRPKNGGKSVAVPKKMGCQKAEKPSTTHPIGSEKSSHQDLARSGNSFYHEKTVPKSPTKAGKSDNDSVNDSWNVLKTFASQTPESRKKILEMLKKETQNAKERSTVYLAETTVTETTKMGNMHALKGMLHGTEGKGTKEGSHTFSQPIKDEDLTYGVVKEEPVDLDYNPSHDAAAASSCLVVIGNKNYLELPTEFPSIIPTRGKVDSRVVLLRGPDKRAMPVMFMRKFGIKILNAGWETFSKANGIQPGDECLFQRQDDQQECIFRLSIVNRQVNGN